MNPSPSRRLLVIIGVLLWLIVVLPAYFVVHKPFASAPGIPPPELTIAVGAIASAIGSLLADLALLALTLAATVAWGSRLLRWLGLPSDSDLEHWALAASLGLGLLGTLVFGLGVAGGFYRWLAYAVLLLLGLTSLSEIRLLARWLASGLSRPRITPIPWLWLYTGVVGLFTLGMALLPPIGWDSLVYHLQGPRLYMEAHRLLAVPETFYLNWPAQVEMLFTWGLLLKGDTLAKLFHWVFWPLVAALLYVFARRVMDARAGRWSVALWASVPFVAELAGVAYVDLGLTAFILGAVYAFYRWSKTQNQRWMTLTALFAGLAMATKYTAATWLAALLLLFVYHAWRNDRRPFGWILPRAIGLGLLAALLVMPWLAKNWIVTGNPVYPFLFGGEAWNPTRNAFLTGSGGGYSRNPLDYIALPWLATVLGLSGTASFDATAGPLLLCLVPLAFLVPGRPKIVNYALVLVGLQLAYFVVTIYGYVYLVETRLLLPVFPLLCLVAAFAFLQLPRWDLRQLRLSRVVGSTVALVLALNLATEAYHFLAVNPLAPLAGLETRDSYLTRRLGAHYATMQYVNEHLPPESRLFFLWEPRSYYCTPPSRGDATLDNLAQLYLAYGDAQTALGALQSEGFTYLLLYRAGLAFLRGPTPRPPTMSSLMGDSSPERSHYPISDDLVLFLDELLAQCQKVASMAGIYEIYRLP